MTKYVATYTKHQKLLTFKVKAVRSKTDWQQ